MPDRIAAVLDANVLYPFMVRDVLLSLAAAGLYRPVWTDRINEEWSRNLIASKPGRTAGILSTIETMNEAFPEARLEGFEDLIETLDLPDANDRHVLAAAIRSEASVIVTQNLSDFPPGVLAQFDIEARAADDFIADIVRLHPRDVARALHVMRARYDAPPLTADELLQSLLKSGLMATAALLKSHRKAL